MVEKSQVHPNPPPTIPEATPLQPTIQHLSTPQHPTPRPRSSRRSSRRSRSHHHRSHSRRHDKQPVSVHQSLRRRRSSRRPRRSSRLRSSSRDPSRQRHESPRRDRESSITLKSASPHRRDDRQPTEEYHQPRDDSSNKPTPQASSWWTNQQSAEDTNPKDNSYYPQQSSSVKWQSWGQWKDYSKNPSSSHHSTWVEPKKSSHRQHTSHDSATKPLTAFSSTKSAPQRHKKKKPNHSGDDQSLFSVSIPSGHMLINLRAGSKKEWIRGVKFGLRHPDRMPAASEVPYEQQPKPTKTVEMEEFQRAVATLQRVDSRNPTEITKKAIHLLASTNLLPMFDLEQPFIIDLPSTNIICWH